MNKKKLTKLNKVILAVLSIVFATSLFSPAFGQVPENLNDDTEVILNDNTEVIEQAVLQDFSQRTGIEIPNPDIKISTEYKEWSNTCLEVKESGNECLNVITPGWEVIIDKAQKRYVYHTNNNGSIVIFKNLITRNSEE